MSQRNDDGLANVEELPLGADNASLGRWCAATTSNPNPTTYSEFVADAIARDRERGLEPIAPSIISDLSVGHKKYLRRYPRIFYSCLVALQLALGSTLVAMVFVVQDVKRFGPIAAHIIWLVVSAAVSITLAGALLLLLMRRNERRKRDREMVKAELEKYKREMRKSQKEVEKVGEHGSRLRREYRSKSREASLRSVSRGRRSKRESDNGSTTIGEVATVLPHQSSHIQNVNRPQQQSMSRVIQASDQEQVPRPVSTPIVQFPPRTSSLRNLSELGPPVPPKDYPPLPSIKTADIPYPSQARLSEVPNHDLGAHDGGYNMSALDRLVPQSTLSPGSIPSPSQPVRSSTTLLSPEPTPTTDLVINEATSVRPQSPTLSTSAELSADLEEGDSFTSAETVIRRAGHGEHGSAQSDENLRANLELDSDAESIGPEHPAWQRRKERSDRVVGAWDGVLVPDDPREVEEIERAGDERIRGRIRDSLEGRRQ